MSRYGVRPRPRLLVIAESQEQAEAAARQVQEELGLETVGVADNLRGVYSPDWDAALVMHQDERRTYPAHLRVLAIAPSVFGPHGLFEHPQFGSSALTNASEVEVVVTEPNHLRKLSQELTQYAARMSEKPYFHPGCAISRPFVVAGASNEFVIAGELLPESGLKRQAPHWLLPPWADPVAWLRCAFDEWGKADPDRFPQLPDWWHTDAWRTPAERRLEEEQESFFRERDAQMAALTSKAEELNEAVEAARLDADSGERLLLTGDGEPLKHQVKVALEEFGFTVDDMDETTPQGDHREDLRVRTPEDEQFEAIVEVTGFRRGGGKVTDLYGALRRFADRYEAEEGRPPSASWYIVSVAASLPPEERPVPLASDDEIVKIFAEDEGLVINTVDLFRLVVDVQAGKLDAAVARGALINARGRFQWPSGDEENPDD